MVEDDGARRIAADDNFTLAGAGTLHPTAFAPAEVAHA
jgi:hypothetical protein